jgi:signal transduction histidine kinase/CheY-like chemotaxis protein
VPTEPIATSPSDPSVGDAVTDERRVRALAALAVLDTPPEERFDRLTRVAKRCLRVPVALVSLVDADRQFFKSQVGLPEPWATDRQTPLTHSFCQHVVRTGEALVVADARHHPVLRDNLAVSDIGVIAYAGVPLVSADGLVMGSFCAIDIEPREWSEDDLATLRDLAEAAMDELGQTLAHAAAEAASRAKDRFLAMLSHELRTPLSPVLLLADAIAADAAVPDSVRADAATISRNVRQQTRLVDDLLDVTRIENGKLSLTTETVDLHELLTEVVADAGADATGKQLALTLATDAARHHASGDAGRLRQVFSNLLRNAVKFTPVGGRVALATANGPDGCLRATVADTGIGVDPAVLHRLFDPFEQGSKSITDEFSGLGLGLAIARGLVEAHGGRIDAASDGPGRGTTFTVDLPTIAPPAASSTCPTAPAASSADRPPGVSILLVEDHKDTLAAMVRLLRRLGHRVTGAESVAAAVAAANTAATAGQPFDLLVSDVDLPDGTGLDLMRQLAADADPTHRPIRGIALTGYGMEADVRRSEAAGFFAHLVKPINFTDLEDAIRRATAV